MPTRRPRSSGTRRRRAAETVGPAFQTAAREPPCAVAVEIISPTAFGFSNSRTTRKGLRPLAQLASCGPLPARRAKSFSVVTRRARRRPRRQPGAPRRIRCRRWWSAKATVFFSGALISARLSKNFSGRPIPAKARMEPFRHSLIRVGLSTGAEDGRPLRAAARMSGSAAVAVADDDDRVGAAELELQRRAERAGGHDVMPLPIPAAGIDGDKAQILGEAGVLEAVIHDDDSDALPRSGAWRRRGAVVRRPRSDAAAARSSASSPTTPGPWTLRIDEERPLGRCRHSRG